MFTGRKPRRLRRGSIVDWRLKCGYWKKRFRLLLEKMRWIVLFALMVALSWAAPPRGQSKAGRTYQRRRIVLSGRSVMMLWCEILPLKTELSITHQNPALMLLSMLWSCTFIYWALYSAGHKIDAVCLNLNRLYAFAGAGRSLLTDASPTQMDAVF